MAWRITRLSEEGRLTHEQASLAKVRGRGFRLLHAAVSAPACRVQLRGARRLQAAAGGQEAAPPTASRNSRPAWLCLRVPSGDAFYCASCVLRLPPSPPPKKTHTPHTITTTRTHPHPHNAHSQAWNTLRGRECVALARELLGGNGVQADFLAAKHFADMEAIYTYEGALRWVLAPFFALRLPECGCAALCLAKLAPRLQECRPHKVQTPQNSQG